MSKNEIDSLEKLKARYAELKSQFNLFSLFHEIFDENAWTRLFSFLTDSKKSLIDTSTFITDWLTQVNRENQSNLASLEKFNKLKIKSSKTIIEWSTLAGRRLDLLIELFDESNSLVGVIGLENKVDSGEQEKQLSDYQSALIEEFPKIPKILFFCTPDGRHSKTAEEIEQCPVLSISYATILDTIINLTHKHEGKQLFLLESLSDYLELLVISNKIKKMTLRQTRRFNNSSTNLFDNLKSSLENIQLPFYLPQFSTYSTNEVQLWVGDFNPVIEEAPLYVCYWLYSEKKKPQVGDLFHVRLSLNYGKLYKIDQEKRNEIIRKFRTIFRVPNSRAELMHSHKWVTIWSSEPYYLKDMGEKDVAGLTNLYKSSIDNTYHHFELTMMEFASRNEKLKPQEIPLIKFENMEIVSINPQTNRFKIKVKLTLGKNTGVTYLYYNSWSAQQDTIAESNFVQEFYKSIKNDNKLVALTEMYFYYYFTKELAELIKNNPNILVA